jgi:hypothetical protein
MVNLLRQGQDHVDRRSLDVDPTAPCLYHAVIPMPRDGAIIFADLIRNPGGGAIRRQARRQRVERTIRME